MDKLLNYNPDLYLEFSHKSSCPKYLCQTLSAL